MENGGEGGEVVGREMTGTDHLAMSAGNRQWNPGQGEGAASLAVCVRDHPHRPDHLVSLLKTEPLLDHARSLFENGPFEVLDDDIQFTAAFQVVHQRRAKLSPVEQDSGLENRHRGESVSTERLWL